jgi:hypothetical protein
VEHAFSLDNVRPWRIAAVVASAVAALELVALVAAGAALVGRRPLVRHRHAAPPVAKASHHPRPPAHATHARTLLARAQTSVLVLNGNGRTGAAAAEAARVRARGYPIRSVGNAPRQTGRSIVMYRPGFRPEAVRLARDLAIGLVGPLDGLRPRELHGARVAVVVGAY